MVFKNVQHACQYNQTTLAGGVRVCVFTVGAGKAAIKWLTLEFANAYFMNE